MTSFIDPAWYQVDSVDSMTKAERANKILVHEHKLHGHTYIVYSKYDGDGVLAQRAMVRRDLIKD